MVLKKQPYYLTALTVLSVGILIVLIIPILAASVYAHPVQDDYLFSMDVHDAILSHGNIFDILAAACKTSAKIYNVWQGTYVAVFLFALQPGSLSHDLYFLTSIIMLTALLSSTFFLSVTVVSRWLRCDKRCAIILASLILSFAIQFIPDIAQGFFWYNGSSYYTLFYSFSLFYYALMIRLLLSERKSHTVLLSVFLFILSFVIGGGNYATAMDTSIISVLICLWCLISRKKGRFLILLATITLLSAFAVSIVAPGNAVRASLHDSLNPFLAIFKSFYYSFGFIGKWTRLPEIAFFIIISPIVYSAAQKARFRFKYPVIGLLLILCIFAAQFTPSVYAMGSPGSGRLLNIYYYSYYWLILTAMFIVFGSIRERYSLPSVVDMTKTAKKRLATAVSCLLLFQIICGCLAYDAKNLTSVKTTYTVISGQAEEYDSDFDEIVQTLETPGEICYIEDVSKTNGIYPRLELNNVEDKNERNEELADYYDHEKVILIETTSESQQSESQP